MTYVTIRELRNHSGEVVDRAAAGETITITRNGTPVAELRPIAKPPMTATRLVTFVQGLACDRPGEVPGRHRRRPGPVDLIPDGILDTSTLMLAERLSPDDLPAYPTITAVTLAE